MEAETAAAGYKPEVVAESELYYWAETVVAVAAFEEAETAAVSKSELAAVLALEQCFEPGAAAESRSESEQAVVSEQCHEPGAAAAHRPEEVAVSEQH